MSVIIFSRRRRLAKKRLSHTGRGLFFGSLLVILGAVVLPVWLDREEAVERFNRLKNAQIHFSDLLRIEADQAPEITEATFFTLDIAKIGAKSKIIANVDPGDKFEYEQALDQGVAHSRGTFLPGMDGNVTLFSHSTDIAANISRFNAVFYRLDELQPGDQIVIWYLGRRYEYRVTGSRITKPEDVSVFTSQPGARKLYLVTCTPRGTTKNRLIVEAEPV